MSEYLVVKHLIHLIVLHGKCNSVHICELTDIFSLGMNQKQNLPNKNYPNPLLSLYIGDLSFLSLQKTLKHWNPVTSANVASLRVFATYLFGDPQLFLNLKLHAKWNIRQWSSEGFFSFFLFTEELEFHPNTYIQVMNPALIPGYIDNFILPLRDNIQILGHFCWLLDSRLV